MSTTRVIHKKNATGAPDEVYIGRPSIFGNPFIIGKDGTRSEVIAKYRTFLYSRPALIQKARAELKGKTLVCFCAPLPCHGDVLAQIVNELPV